MASLNPTKKTMASRRRRPSVSRMGESPTKGYRYSFAMAWRAASAAERASW